MYNPVGEIAECVTATVTSAAAAMERNVASYTLATAPAEIPRERTREWVCVPQIPHKNKKVTSQPPDLLTHFEPLRRSDMQSQLERDRALNFDLLLVSSAWLESEPDSLTAFLAFTVGIGVADRDFLPG